VDAKVKPTGSATLEYLATGHRKLARFQLADAAKLGFDVSAKSIE